RPLAELRSGRRRARRVAAGLARAARAREPARCRGRRHSLGRRSAWRAEGGGWGRSPADHLRGPDRGRCRRRPGGARGARRADLFGRRDRAALGAAAGNGLRPRGCGRARVGSRSRIAERGMSGLYLMFEPYWLMLPDIVRDIVVILLKIVVV